MNEYEQEIFDLIRWWNGQEPEIQEFNDKVEPLYNRIEDASALSLAGEKTTLEFTPVELETLLEAVGCAFEYHEYRRVAATKGILVDVIEQIIGDTSIQDGRTKLKAIKRIVSPAIPNEKTLPNRKKAIEYHWLIGEIPEDIERFFMDELKNIKQIMLNKDTPISPSEAKTVLAERYYGGEIESCRKALYRAGVRSHKTGSMAVDENEAI